MKSNLFKSIAILLLFIIVGLGFSKSYTSYTIDNLDFVIALGVDVSNSDSNKIKVCFEFSKVSTSSNGSSASSNESIINTVEADSIDSAINLMNVHMGKEIKLSHCKLFVFSEKIAEKGLASYIYTIANNVQTRPTANIIISKCDTETYLQNSDPSIENYITKYYQVFSNSGKYTGYTSNSTIGDFLYALSTSTCEPVAILSGISEKDNTQYQSINNIKAGTSPISSDRLAENIGLAIFKNDCLVGELSALDTLAYSILTNQVNSFMISIPNPENSSDYLDIYLYDDMYTDSTIDIINGTPYISTKAKLVGRN